MLNDKRGVIGRTLAKIPEQYREVSFMFGQLREFTSYTWSALCSQVPTVYSIVTELPAVFVLYDSAFWSSAYILFLFGVCTWNGGGFYIEVFGRK